MGRTVEFLMVVVLAIGMVIAWLGGWPAIASSLFLIGFAFKLTILLALSLRMSRGVNLHPEVALASVTLAIEKGASRKFTALVLVSIGEAACWPARALVGAAQIAITVQAQRRRHFETTHLQSLVLFRFPLSLVIALAFALQSIFMLTAFDGSDEGLLVFRAAVIVQIIGFICFALHFFGRRRFLKNFSASALKPLTFFLCASILAVLNAILLRDVLTDAFFGTVSQLSAGGLFDTLRAIINNSGVFSFPEMIGDSSSLEDFIDRVGGFILTIDVLKAFDIFLGVSVLSTFGRALLAVFQFERDDDDRNARVVAHLQSAAFKSARREAEEISDASRRAEALAFVALGERDYRRFEGQTRRLDRSNSLRWTGDEPRVVEFNALLRAAVLLPLTFEEFCPLIQAHWERHANPASVLSLAVTFLGFRKTEMATILDLRTRFDALETVYDTFEILFTEPEEDGDREGGFAPRILARFGEDRISMVLLALQLSIGSGMSPEIGERKARLKQEIDDALAFIERRLRAGAPLEPISFALLPGLYTAPHVYAQVFGVKCDRFEWIIDEYERRMEAADISLPGIYASFRRSRFRIA